LQETSQISWRRFEELLKLNKEFFSKGNILCSRGEEMAIKA
jgi:hypothetical protein